MPSQLGAVSGIAYYISAPHSLTAALTDPLHTVIYIFFICSACAMFSKTWIEVSGSGPRDVAKQLKDQSMTLAGHRDASIYKELKRVIPTAAAFGGATLGLLSVVADMMGALGSGTGILMATTIIYGCECRVYPSIAVTLSGDPFRRLRARRQGEFGDRRCRLGRSSYVLQRRVKCACLVF